MKISSKKGFTFIEIILVVAIIVTTGALFVAFSGTWFFGRSTETTLEIFRSAVRQAQVFSMGGRGDSSWGVAVRDGSIVLFRGPNYDTRDGAFDVSYDIPSGVTISGYDMVVAERGSGRMSGTREGLQIAGFGNTINFSFSADGGFMEE